MFTLAPEEFYYANIEKITESAKILASKKNISFSDQLAEMKDKYVNKIGTGDEECVFIDSKKVPTDIIIADMRHLPSEIFEIFCNVKGEWIEVFRKDGGLSGVDNICIDEMNQAILSFRISHYLSNMMLYVVHNHPYIYNASPSEADLMAAKALYENIEIMKSESKRLGRPLQIQIIDFCIVTDYDYWSIKQQCEKI